MSLLDKLPPEVLAAAQAAQPAPLKPAPLIDPALTVELADIQIALPPIDPRIINEPREWYASDEEHLAVISNARSALGRLMSVTGYVLDENAVGLLSDRYRACCPCDVEPYEHDFIVRKTTDTRRIFGACLAGCSPDAIATAAVEAITTHEASALSDVLERVTIVQQADTQALIDEMDVCALPVHVQEWSVPLIAPARASSLLVGESGDGKTWLLLLAMICKALGVPFLGRPVTRGRVLAALLESREINAGRIDYLVRGLGRTREELRGWLDLWPVGLDLKTDNRESRGELARRFRARHYDFLGVDNGTKIRSSRSQNAENDSSVLSAVLEPLAELANNGRIDGERVTDRPPAIVTLVHGDGRPRGSSAQPQHVDYVLALARKSQRDPESPITLATGDGCRIVCDELPITMRFRGIAPNPIEVELDGEAPSTDKVARLAALVEVVRRNPGCGINEISRDTNRPGKRELGKDLDELDRSNGVENGPLRRDVKTKKYYLAD